MKIKIFSGSIHSKTAGLSASNNERVELFLAGCKMAREGHPCAGCFNSELWNDFKSEEMEVNEVLEYVTKMTDNKYITIVGGEPLDQYEALVELLKVFHENDFHIVLITHYTLLEIAAKYSAIFPYVNIIIDGKYDASKRIFDTDKRPGIYHVVGSSNQRIWYRVNDTFVDVSKESDLKCYYSF